MPPLRRLVLGLAALLVAPSGQAPAGEKERLLFRAQAADTYAARDAHEGVTVAAQPFDTREKVKAVFGKHDLLKAGILPLLVVITNNTDQTVRLDDLSVQLLTADRQKVQPVPAATVLMRLKGKEGYPRDPAPSPIPRFPRSTRGGAVEVQVHEFSMRMAPPRATAGGFFYFDVGRGRDWVTGSSIYVTQLFWAHNARPLMFFEVTLDDARRPSAPAVSAVSTVSK